LQLANLNEKAQLRGDGEHVLTLLHVLHHFLKSTIPGAG
jgi:hypothetical protein